MKRTHSKSHLIIALCMLGILFLCLGNFFMCKRNLYNQTITPLELESYDNIILNDILYITPNNSISGTAASTQPLKLSKGSYIVYVTYNTTHTGSTLSATSTTLAPQHIRTNPTYLSPNEHTAILKFELLRDREDILLNINYSGLGNLDIHGLSIHQTTDSAKAALIHALMLCLLLGFCYFLYHCALDKRKVVFSLTLITLFASYPLFFDYLIVGHDLPFHLLRIDSIKQGLEQGIFPVKIHPCPANEYGYASGVFYGDLFLYFPAVLRIMGLPLQSAYQYFVFAVNIATVLISYYCFKKLFQSPKWGLLGCMLYTLSFYRLLNVYTRAAVGEYCAMIFLPLIFLGLYQIFTQSQENLNWRYALLPALGLTGIIQCHILTCEMVAIFILLTCIILWKKVIRPKTFLTLSLTVLLTLLLNAGFIIPFADYYFTEDFIINSASWSTASVQSMGLFLPQMFSILPDSVGGTWSTASGVMNEFDPAIGLPLLFGLLLFIYTLISSSKENDTKTSRGSSRFTFLYSILALFMSTCYFPYDTIAESGGLGRALVSSLQFPWRFLSLATLFITICCCFALSQNEEIHIPKTSNTAMAHMYHSIIVFLLCIFTVFSASWYYYRYVAEGAPYRVYDTYELPTTQLYSCEYLPEGTMINDILENHYEASNDICISMIQKQGTSITCQIDNSGADGYVELPLTLYKGYIAKHTETNTLLPLQFGRNNCIRVEIPEGFIGTLSVSFQEPVYWRIAEIISLLSFLGLFILVGHKYYKKKA